MAQRFGNAPVTHGFLAGRQHDLSRVERFDDAGTLHCRREQSILSRCNLEELAAVAHRQTHRAPEPKQILGPEIARYQVEISPILLPEAGLMPRLIGETGDIEIRPG